MKKLRLAGLTLATSLALAGAAYAQDITIGVAGPMTGANATFGQQLKAGSELAIADINAAGGVLGKKLKMEIGDDACDIAWCEGVEVEFGFDRNLERQKSKATRQKENREVVARQALHCCLLPVAFFLS